jgi:flagellin-specific chaperone FliS
MSSNINEPGSPSTPNGNQNQNQGNQNQINTLTNETINGDGYVVTNTQTNTVDVNVVTDTTFDTIDPSNNIVVDITQDLSGTVTYNYDDNVITQSDNLVSEIRQYAQLIKCEDFHGKGTIDDYQVLFDAASRIATESKQMQLDIDIEGFDNFGRAADELSNLFTSFTKKLQSVNVINDISFLTSILNALKKIYNLSEVFGKFKETIVITSDIRIPKSLQETKNILTEVMDELNCAMGYIGNFVVRDSNLPAGQLSAKDKNIIQKAADTIDNWNTLCEHGVTIALTNSTDIQAIKNMNSELKTKSLALQNVTNTLRTRLQNLNL